MTILQIHLATILPPEPSMKTPTIKTPDGFVDVIDQLARDHKALDLLEAAEKQEILRVRDKRAERIAELKDAIKAATKAASTYLRKHAARLLPGSRRSAETQLAEYGLRGSTSIVALSSEWDDEKTIEACLQRGFDTCVVTVVKLDKEALEKLTDEELASVGRRRRPAESFWIRPKTGADKATSTAA